MSHVEPHVESPRQLLAHPTHCDALQYCGVLVTEGVTVAVADGAMIGPHEPLGQYVQSPSALTAQQSAYNVELTRGFELLIQTPYPLQYNHTAEPT